MAGAHLRGRDLHRDGKKLGLVAFRVGGEQGFQLVGGGHDSAALGLYSFYT